MKQDQIDKFEWHVRRIQVAEGGRMVGEKKLRTLAREHRCKCKVWWPKRSTTVVQRGSVLKQEEVLFPGYVLLGKPEGRWPCGRCALPLMPIVVDLERKPLAPSVVNLISLLEGEDRGLGEHVGKGQTVRIVGGGLRGLSGEFVGLTCAQVPRAIVHVNLFGRQIVRANLLLTEIEVEK